MCRRTPGYFGQKIGLLVFAIETCIILATGVHDDPPQLSPTLHWASLGLENMAGRRANAIRPGDLRLDCAKMIVLNGLGHGWESTSTNNLIGTKHIIIIINWRNHSFLIHKRNGTPVHPRRHWFTLWALTDQALQDFSLWQAFAGVPLRAWNSSHH